MSESKINDHLRRTLAKMELALGAVDQGIVWTNAQGLVLWCNTYFFQLLNRSKLEIINHPLHLFFPPVTQRASPPPLEEHLLTCLREKSKEKFTYFLLQDNKQLTLEINCAYFSHKIQDQLETGLVLTFKDITKTLEQQLQLTQIEAEVIKTKRTQEKLSLSLKQKETLLKEIHHRIKNNLLVVSSLIEWQSETLKNSSALEIMQDCQMRIYTMALVHEKMYRADNLSQIELGEYMQDLAQHLLKMTDLAQHKITLKIETEPVFVNIETAVPCGLIFNELFLNSLKHAFPDQREGIITLKLLLNDQTNIISLIVADNGVGLPETFDITQSETLGLQLISMLVHQLDGHLSIVNQPGVEFKIDFSELQYKKRV
ncbi:MAG: histidine kinase dimerization/phosphoacceptor domain -containing protein [Synechococcus sp.]|nr:histidine kinase dimerization/phosphoacceptor domain -containing protein [Synechococcus sp.]